MDIRVIITSFTETNFAKLVFRGPLKSVVETTVRVYPVRPLGFGNAIVSLSRSCGNIAVDHGLRFANHDFRWG